MTNLEIADLILERDSLDARIGREIAERYPRGAAITWFVRGYYQEGNVLDSCGERLYVTNRRTGRNVWIAYGVVHAPSN